MTLFYKKTKARRFILGMAGILISAGGFWVYGKITDKPDAPRYVLVRPERGTLVVSVSGNGQVSAKNTIEIKPRISGDIVSLRAKEGARVKSGDIITVIDSKDAKRAVRDAENNLEGSRLALQKLLKPADALAVLQAENAFSQSKRELEKLLEPPDVLSFLQAENALSSAKTSTQNADDSIVKTREDGMASVANAFLDLPAIMTELDDLLFKDTIVKNQWNINWYADQSRQWNDTIPEQYAATELLNKKLRAAYDNNLASYTTIARAAQPYDRDVEIKKTYNTVALAAETIKTTRTYIASAKDIMTLHNLTIPFAVAGHQATLDAYTATINNHLSSLLSSTQGLDNAKKSLEAAERFAKEKIEAFEKLKKGADADVLESAREKVREREKALAKLKEGADELDIASQKLAVKQREQAFADAVEKLADYMVRAPFDGILASLDMKAGDSVSPSMAIGSLITKEKLAEISLNEVDVSAVRMRQKATLTFDALLEFSVVGQVVEIDTVGESAQGVVAFMVTIGFDAADERLKPGMSVSASIITATKNDALLVPNVAVKTDDDSSYVLVSETRTGQARRKNVKVGISNEEKTEILSGITEQDLIVVRTIQPMQNNAPQQRQRSIFQAPGSQVRGGGNGGGGGGAMFHAR